VDILGLTFDEAAAACASRPHERPALRLAYRAALASGASGDLRATPLPVVRQHVEGETVKLIQQTADGDEVESVVVPMARGGRAWSTLCVSSQIGCAHGCRFCQTGQLGLRRSLSAAEIVGQVVAAQRLRGEPVRNVVFMGMGEPFDNFENVVQAIRVLCDPTGLSFARERNRISTVGRVDGIRRLAALGWRRIDLAVSLNAPNDTIRSRLMPINDLEPMGALREALLAYPLRRCQYIMIEYVLIPGVNDARLHASELAAFLRPLRCIVNVIPYNPRPGSAWAAPDEAQVGQFLRWLREAGQHCTRRVTKGRRQMAACGQLGRRAAGAG
jgi:23S rRNA (adenine2503-C2)-methyltransferase